MANVFNTSIFSKENKNIRYIILEDDIAYDWDDYDLWGAVLYDMVEDKIITRKFGHGTDMDERKDSITLEEACVHSVKFNVLIDAMFKALPFGLDLYNAVCGRSKNDMTAIPVNVVRGRKFKGEGYLVYAEKEAVRYGYGAYRGEYNHYPVIFDPKTGTFNKVNSFGYLEIADEVCKAYREEIRKNIPNTLQNVRSLAHMWAYNMSYSSCDADNYRSMVKRYSSLAMGMFEMPAMITEAVKRENEEVRIAREALWQEKKAGIMEWVLSKTEKRGEDAERLAFHIFNKNY